MGNFDVVESFIVCLPQLIRYILAYIYLYKDIYVVINIQFFIYFLKVYQKSFWTFLKNIQLYGSKRYDTVLSYENFVLIKKIYIHISPQYLL